MKQIRLNIFHEISRWQKMFYETTKKQGIAKLFLKS